jgi:hypothetical protein
MFKITIEETKIEKKIAGTEWERTGKDEPAYAYTPEIEKQVEVTREIFRQIVEEIDLEAVIKAVNSIT